MVSFHTGVGFLKRVFSTTPPSFQFFFFFFFLTHLIILHKKKTSCHTQCAAGRKALEMKTVLPLYSGLVYGALKSSKRLDSSPLVGQKKDKTVHADYIMNRIS